MTDLLSFIKGKTSKKYDDYDVLQSTIRYANRPISNTRTKIITATSSKKFNNMKGGGFALKVGSLNKILLNFRTFAPAVKDKDSNIDYANILEIYNNLVGKSDDYDYNIMSYDNEAEFILAVKTLADESSKVKQEIIEEETSDNPTVTTVPSLTALEVAENATPTEESSTEKPKNVQPKPYETLEVGRPLYHPSQDIKRFGENVIFVNLPDVLDKNKQRSFVMFFTENEEYARRYSGMWSLNKRPVYVHKFNVIKDIPGIKVIDPNMIPDSLENKQLAQGMCGPSEDGIIHGIKIGQPTSDINGGNGEPVTEYYICNPEEYLEHKETWMQFDSTQWVKITDKSSIVVPQTQETTGEEPEPCEEQPCEQIAAEDVVEQESEPTEKPKEEED